MAAESQLRRPLRSLCIMFNKISEAYVSGLGSSHPGCDLLLQIIPRDWVALKQTIPVRRPSQYNFLAKAVYDKCSMQPVSDGPYGSEYASASLFELSPQVPAGVDFHLSAAGAPGILEHSSVIHIGYTWNPGCRWLFCAITDELGCHHWTASFLVGSPKDPWTVFRAIASEIYELTGDILGPKRRSCTIYVAKSSRMHDNEIKSKSHRRPQRQTIDRWQFGPP